MPQDINNKIMGHLEGRIHALNYSYFTEDELDFDGIMHKKIIVHYNVI